MQISMKAVVNTTRGWYRIDSSNTAYRRERTTGSHALNEENDTTLKKPNRFVWPEAYESKVKKWKYLVEAKRWNDMQVLIRSLQDLFIILESLGGFRQSESLQRN